MKKFLLAAVGLVLFSQVSFSQIQIGVRGGLNISNVVGKDVEEADFKLGPHVGPFLRVKAGDRIIIQPEVLFSMKGTSYSNGNAKWSQRLNYIDIPLMVGFKPTDGFGILLGVQPSLLVGAKQTFEFNGKKTSETSTDGLSKFDFGAVAGLQFQTESGFDFSKHEEHTYLFLKEVAHELESKDLNHVGRVVTAVLHTLRDHLSITESIQFISQLPLYVKAVYVEKWKPSKHSRVKHVDDFLNEVRSNSGHTANVDFKNNETTKESIKAVFRVIRKYVSNGEVEDVKSQLPHEIGKLI